MLLGWAALLGVLGVVAALPAVRPAALGLWWAANGLLVAAAWLGSLVHLRSVLDAAGAAWRWTVALSVLASLASFSWLERFLAEQLSFRFPSSWLLLGILTLFCVLVIPVFLTGLTGAAIAILLRPRGDDPQAAARLGVSAWWTVAIGMMLLERALAAFGAPEAWSPVLMGGLPLLQGCLCRTLRHLRVDPAVLLQAVLGALARRLVWRRKRGGSIDLRGAVLGLAASGAAVLIGATGILAPAQAGALAGLIRLRNQPIMAGSTSFSQIEDDTWRSERSSLSLVLLTLDAPVRRAALTQTSEAAVQAAVIRQLGKWGATRVVLPQPVLQTDALPEAWRADLQPLPDSAAIRRTVRDIPSLAAAMRTAGNVVLAVGTPFSPRNAAARLSGTASEGQVPQTLRPLRAAAREVASAEVTSFGQSQVPAIEVGTTGRTTLPVLLAALSRGVYAPVITASGRDQVTIAGIRTPVVERDKVLVDFQAAESGGRFPHVSYGEILRSELLYIPAAPAAPTSGSAPGPPGAAEAERGRWVSPQEFFRGKIVFLDTLSAPVRDTPIGTMPLSEVLANATATLLSPDPIRRPDGVLAILTTLVLGAAVGWKCTRRDPLQAGWQTGVVLTTVLAVTLVEFLSQNLWIDPVVPLLAIGASYLLVTQMTFSLERRERERNRALLQRFVAPEVVDELLDSPEEMLGLGGQRRQVCIIFADVRGFTQFAERHTPEEVVGVINGYLTAMTEAMFAFRGLLDKYTGDGLMALFPVTGAPEADVARAVRAALAMRDAAEIVSARLIAEGRQPLRIGIGVHFGEAVIGLVGNPNRFDFTALGHSVVVGARLQRLAGGGEVVVSESVYLLASDSLPELDAQPVTGEGILEAVRPYRITQGGRAVLPEGAGARPVA